MGLVKRVLRPFYARAFELYRRYFFDRALGWHRLEFEAGEPRRAMLAQAMDYASHSVEGDYLEFGVSTGRTFVAAWEHAQRAGLARMRFFAFDSFRGLPEARGVDALGFQHAAFEAGAYACSDEEFRALLKRRGVDASRVTLVPGWYSEVLNPATASTLPLKTAAVVWIDCDFYESTVSVLDFLTPYVQDGTLLVFDDWFCFRGDPERGEQRAFREWLERNTSIRATELLRFGWHGTSFILRRPA
jgi:hypothetical protein